MLLSVVFEKSLTYGFVEVAFETISSVEIDV
jgi:hypothetical protein